MRRTLILSLGSLALTLAAGVAHATDLCLTFQGGEVLVIKRTGKAVPQPDTCAPIAGFFQGNAAFSVVSGTACTSADGGTLSLAWSTSQNQDVRGHIANAQILLQSVPDPGSSSFGTANFLFLAPGALPSFTSNYSAAAAACGTQPVP